MTILETVEYGVVHDTLIPVRSCHDGTTFGAMLASADWRRSSHAFRWIGEMGKATQTSTTRSPTDAPIGSASHIVLGVGPELVSLNAGRGTFESQRFGGCGRGRECLSKQLRRALRGYGATGRQGGPGKACRAVSRQAGAVCRFRMKVMPQPCTLWSRLPGG